MCNYVLVDKQSGKIINALSTPTEGVCLEPENDGQEVWEITQEEFQAILEGAYRYWNYVSQEFEPEAAYKWVLKSQEPYYAGIVTLTFTQHSWKDEATTTPVMAKVTINGDVMEVYVDDGVLEIELDCPEPAKVRVKIEANRHETYEKEVIIYDESSV